MQSGHAQDLAAQRYIQLGSTKLQYRTWVGRVEHLVLLCTSRAAMDGPPGWPAGWRRPARAPVVRAGLGRARTLVSTSGGGGSAAAAGPPDSRRLGAPPALSPPNGSLRLLCICVGVCVRFWSPTPKGGGAATPPRTKRLGASRRCAAYAAPGVGPLLLRDVCSPGQRPARRLHCRPEPPGVRKPCTPGRSVPSSRPTHSFAFAERQRDEPPPRPHESHCGFVTA
jgi:hypothetical protein